MADNTYKPQMTGPMQKPQQNYFGNTYSPYAGYGGVSTYSMPNLDQMMGGLQNAPSYSYNQYKTPYQQSVGSLGSHVNQTSAAMGNYGLTNPAKMNQMYQDSFNLGARPIKANAAETMRNMSQGWGGNRFGQSAAFKGLQRRTAMDTGEQLNNLGQTLGTDLNKLKLGEEQEARSKEWDAKSQAAQQWMEGMLKDKYQNAMMDYQGAQFGDEQSRYYSTQAFDRAKAMFDYGKWFPEFQLQAEQLGNQSYNQAMGGFGGLNQG